MSKLTCVASVALVGLLVGLGIHVAGFVTQFWMAADEAGSGLDTAIAKINIGLWKMHQELRNGTTFDTDSPLVKKEEQYIVLAIAAANALFCLIIIVKAVHICVGLVSFVSVAMMLIAAYFVYTNVESRMNKLKDQHTDWPELKLSYSFYLTFSGILLNIVATVIFLTVLLLREEGKAAKSTKGLGVDSEYANLNSNDVLEDTHKYEVKHTKTSSKSAMSSGQTTSTSGKTSTYVTKSSVHIISGNNSVYENMAYSSNSDSVHAGPSSGDNFSHIIQSERL